MGTMNQTDWLAQLAPDRAPPAPGWWPLAPGWWLLAGLIILVTVCVLFRLRNPNRRLRRLALRELDTIEVANAPPAAMAVALENLMRRFALARFGRERVARLSGQTWLAFVVAEGGQAFANEAGHSLLAAAYGGATEDDRARWLAGARAFLSKAGARRRRRT
jgi:hypothetical protein